MLKHLMLAVNDLVYIWLSSVYFGVPVNITHSLSIGNSPSINSVIGILL